MNKRSQRRWMRRSIGEARTKKTNERSREGEIRNRRRQSDNNNNNNNINSISRIIII